MHDRLLQARMAYCGPKGIPLSRFLSWPDDDQQAALAWQARESRRCGGCGTHLDEWRTDQGGDRFAYHAETYACPGCAELSRMQDSGNPVRGQQYRLAPGHLSECPRCP